jgi:hypothetical protein
MRVGIEKEKKSHHYVTKRPLSKEGGMRNGNRKEGNVLEI